MEWWFQTTVLRASGSQIQVAFLTPHLRWSLSGLNVYQVIFITNQTMERAVLSLPLLSRYHSHFSSFPGWVGKKKLASNSPSFLPLGGSANYCTSSITWSPRLWCSYNTCVIHKKSMRPFTLFLGCGKLSWIFLLLPLKKNSYLFTFFPLFFEFHI
jgi:hypothetical protein